MGSLASLNPLDFPQAWDYILIGRAQSPGYCEVQEFKRRHEFDIKKGKGTIGGTLTFVGRPPAKGSIKFWLWTQAHFAAWETFLPLLKYTPTKKGINAVDIYHPSLSAVDINSVVTESIGNVIHEGNQFYSITVDFIEYFPPPKASAVSTPTSSQNLASGTTPGTPPLDAPDQYQQQIAQLLKQAQAP